MCKLIGSLLLIIGTTGISFCSCAQMRRKLIVLSRMEGLLRLIYSQVSYRSEALPEICRTISNQTDGDFPQMLMEMYETWNCRPGMPFPQIWKTCSRKYADAWGLNKEERMILEKFGTQFGYADRELQKRSMESMIDRLSQYIEICRRKKSERERMIMSFGIMGGLLSVIILI